MPDYTEYTVHVHPEAFENAAPCSRLYPSWETPIQTHGYESSRDARTIMGKGGPTGTRGHQLT